MAGDFLNIREGPGITCRVVQRLESGVNGIVLSFWKTGSVSGNDLVRTAGGGNGGGRGQGVRPGSLIFRAPSDCKGLQSFASTKSIIVAPDAWPFDYNRLCS
jgi:hypothetical protein